MSVTSKYLTFLTPVTEERVLILNKQVDAPRSVHLRHLNKSGQPGPVTVKWQESQDGVNWDDIAGTSQVVNAGAGTAWLIVSNKPFVALAAFGNVDVEVKIDRSDPDTSLPITVNL